LFIFAFLTLSFRLRRCFCLLFHQISQIEYAIARYLLQSIDSLFKFYSLFYYFCQILGKGKCWLRKLLSTVRSLLNLWFFVLSLLLTISTSCRLVLGSEKSAAIVEFFKIFEQHFCRLVVAIM
jgi:uncharacterized membrane-anchored protein